MSSQHFRKLPPSDRLRLLVGGMRYYGPNRRILTALEYLADELEAAEQVAVEASSAQSGDTPEDVGAGPG